MGNGNTVQRIISGEIRQPLVRNFTDQGRELVKIGDNYISRYARIGDNFKIGKFCIIESDVIIGDGVRIDNYVLLKQGTLVGDGTVIESYVRSSGYNRIGKDCVLKYGVTIARNVIIHDNVFISPNVMTIYADMEGDSHPSPISIGDDVFIGTAAVINYGVQIAHGVKIGAMSYIRKDCDKPGGVYVGSPARKIK